jgi:hypothetical protein
MKLHPAYKAAKKLLHQHGFDVLQCGTLSAHIICRDYNDRPLIVDFILSAHDDIGKISVPWFNDTHSMYAEVSKLHGATFEF